MPAAALIAIVLAFVAASATAMATVGFGLFALKGLGGKRAVIWLVDRRKHLLATSIAAGAGALAILAMRGGSTAAVAVTGALVAGSALLWTLFLLNVPERRFRAIVDPPLAPATGVDAAPDTRVLAFDLPDGPRAIVVNVAAWHHIFELPAGDDWFVGTY